MRRQTVGTMDNEIKATLTSFNTEIWNISAFPFPFDGEPGWSSEHSRSLHIHTILYSVFLQPLDPDIIMTRRFVGSFPKLVELSAKCKMWMQTGDSYDTHMRIQFFMSMKKSFHFELKVFILMCCLLHSLLRRGGNFPEATRSWACMNIQSCVICCQLEGYGREGAIEGVCIEQVWQA